MQIVLYLSLSEIGYRDPLFIVVSKSSSSSPRAALDMFGRGEKWKERI